MKINCGTHFQHDGAIKQKQLRNGSMTTDYRSFCQFSTIEKYWVMLKQKVTAGNPCLLFHLKLPIKKVWIKKITPKYSEKLCFSMLGHIQAVLKNKGHTPNTNLS